MTRELIDISRVSGVFSATIIATVVKDATLLRTGEWQLLLGIISLPGVFIGAWLVRHIGSRWLLIFGFSGYIVLGLVSRAASVQVLSPFVTN